MQKRLGIYGGTFDPIHMGHLIVAEMTRQECSLDKVLFIPAGIPPHKKGKGISPGSQRSDMVKLAIENNPHFEFCDIELKREGTSFTIDTLRALRQLYQEEYEFWMIIGGDSLLELGTWKDVDELVKMCNFAVYMRSDAQSTRYEACITKLLDKTTMNVVLVQAPMIEISSTDIRQRVAQGKSIRYMVPDAVWEYIIDKGLFTNSQ